MAGSPPASVGRVEISPARTLGPGELSGRPQPRAALPRLPARRPLQLERWPRPAALYSALAARSLYSRLAMGRARERGRLPTCGDLG